jgi:predicted PurR-regulated permease PerM
MIAGTVAVSCTMTDLSDDRAPRASTYAPLVGGPGRRLVVWLGIGSWSILGVVVLLSIAVAALSVISSVVLPLVFAVVLAVVFRPVAARLEGAGLRPTVAAGIVVIGLVVLVAAVVALAVDGIVDQTSEIGAQVGDALDEAGFEPATATDLTEALGSLSPAVTQGFAHAVVGGLGTLAGLAAGAVLGVLIMYYLLKDGVHIRRSIVQLVPPSNRALVDRLIGDACFVMRKYGQGRTTLSGIVAFAIGVAGVLLGLPLALTLVVVNFIGGYVPYIGAVVGGGLAVAVALGDGGVTAAFVMLIVVLGSNLILENFVEPKVMGRTLDIHPMIVLVVTAVGGIVGGLVGLMLAVPFTVILMRSIAMLRTTEVFGDLADRARPTVDTIIAAATSSPDAH